MGNLWHFFGLPDPEGNGPMGAHARLIEGSQFTVLGLAGDAVAYLETLAGLM